MRRLVGIVWDIALLRGQPRDLPSSIGLLVLAAAASFGLELLALQLAQYPETALDHSLLDLGLTTVVFSALLLVFRRSHRLPQTLTALFAVDALLMLPMLALLAINHVPFGGEDLDTLLKACQIAVLMWSILVTGHIVRAALDVPLFTGLAVAMSYAAIAIALAVRLMPALPSPAG